MSRPPAFPRRRLARPHRTTPRFDELETRTLFATGILSSLAPLPTMQFLDALVSHPTTPSLPADQVRLAGSPTSTNQGTQINPVVLSTSGNQMEVVVPQVQVDVTVSRIAGFLSVVSTRVSINLAIFQLSPTSTTPETSTNTPVVAVPAVPPGTTITPPSEGTTGTTGSGTTGNGLVTTPPTVTTPAASPVTTASSGGRSGTSQGTSTNGTQSTQTTNGAVVSLVTGVVLPTVTSTPATTTTTILNATTVPSTGIAPLPTLPAAVATSVQNNLPGSTPFQLPGTASPLSLPPVNRTLHAAPDGGGYVEEPDPQWSSAADNCVPATPTTPAPAVTPDAQPAETPQAPPMIPEAYWSEFAPDLDAAATLELPSHSLPMQSGGAVAVLALAAGGYWGVPAPRQRAVVSRQTPRLEKDEKPRQE